MSDTNGTTPAPEGATIRPSWARHTSIDAEATSHRRRFAAQVDAPQTIVELYQHEDHDGTVIEAGAAVYVTFEPASVEDLRAVAVALLEAAEVMKVDGPAVVRS